jgi:hypothetical protein
MKKFILFAIFLMALAPQTAHADAAADNEYMNLVSKAMTNPATVNWPDLRRAYAMSSFYKPYGAMTLWPEFYTAGKTAAMTKSPDAVMEFKKMQQQHWGNLNEHLEALKIASETQSDLIDKSLEQSALEGIADSIIEGADGSSPAKAYRIVVPEEEKLVIETYLGAKITGQEHSKSGDGHTYDLISFVDPKTKKPAKVFFGTDMITSHEGN